MVVQIIVSFGVLTIIRHLVFRGPKGGHPHARKGVEVSETTGGPAASLPPSIQSPCPK